MADDDVTDFDEREGDDVKEMPRRQVGYRLIVNVAGPGFADEVKIEAKMDERESLTPKFIKQEGVNWERYGTDDDFIEIRRDFVVARSVNPVFEDTDPSDVVGDGIATMEPGRGNITRRGDRE